MTANDDLSADNYDIGYYVAIADQLEHCQFTPQDFSEVFVDLELQDIRPCLALFQKLTKDLELEDDELEFPKQNIDDLNYRYINTDRQMANHFKYTLTKNTKALNQIQRKVENEAFSETVIETYTFHLENPLKY